MDFQNLLDHIRNVESQDGEYVNELVKYAKKLVTLANSNAVDARGRVTMSSVNLLNPPVTGRVLKLNLTIHLPEGDMAIRKRRTSITVPIGLRAGHGGTELQFGDGSFQAYPSVNDAEVALWATAAASVRPYQAERQDAST